MGTIIELIPVIEALLAKGPDLIAEAQAVWKWATSVVAPTADENARIAAAFEASYKAFQDSP
jgi:hypothetical protein